MGIDAFSVERLTTKDLPDCVALAHAVGWADSESDWRVIHDAALVLGVRHQGALIAQGALGVYGRAGTIAKMIVAPAFQRRRLSSRILERLLAEGRAKGVDVFGLVATSQGQPLYEKWKFEPVGQVTVLTGAPRRSDETLRLTQLNDAAAAIGFEARVIGVERTSMLRARFREALATASLRAPSGELSGYAMASAQGPLALVGPLIAPTDEDACALARAIFHSVEGEVRVDVPSEQRFFLQWLKEMGLVQRGVRTEMALGSTRLPWHVPERFALAAQAWG